MAQWLGVGTGKDGTIPSSGTYGGTNLACTGSASSTTLSYSGSFTAGDLVLIHQFKGSGVGQWELNQIVSANTVVIPLSYTYTTGAQVIEVREYTGGTLSGTLTCNAWDGSVGGILPVMWNGLLSGSGLLSAAEKGFRGGQSVNSTQAPTPGVHGYSGEGSNNNSTQGERDPSGTNAGGAGLRNGLDSAGGGAGGGNASAGTNGTNGQGLGGVAGESSGQADLVLAIPGGAGGSGGGEQNATSSSFASGVGGRGGGLVFLFGAGWTNTLQVSANGAVGGDCTQGTGVDSGGAGGGGAAGCILGKILSADVGTNLFTALGGNGGVAVGAGGNGGAGSNGRIRIELCSSLTGTTNPTASTSIGGHTYCQSDFAGMV